MNRANLEKCSHRRLWHVYPALIPGTNPCATFPTAFKRGTSQAMWCHFHLSNPSFVLSSQLLVPASLPPTPLLRPSYVSLSPPCPACSNL